MYRPTMSMYRPAIAMYRPTMSMYRPTMAMHRLTMAMHRPAMAMHRSVKINATQQTCVYTVAFKERGFEFPPSLVGKGVGG